MYFQLLVQIKDRVLRLQTVEEKKQYLKKEFLNLKKDICQEEFYNFLRLWVPQFDRDRKSFNMKESKIARYIAKMLNLPDGPDKSMLTKGSSNSPADFAQIVSFVTKKYIIEPKIPISLTDFNFHLDEITNRKSDAELDHLFYELFQKLYTNEREWAIRIILKDLKLGIPYNKILECFHEKAADYFSSFGDLKMMIKALWDPLATYDDVSVELFKPFQPMLCKRVDGTKFRSSFPNDNVFYVENKFDGERFQLHMDNNNFKYYSRNGFDFTEHFGSDYSSGLLTPKLKDLIHEDVEKVIFDGEMMLWNTQTEEFGSKGLSFDVKKLKEDHKYQPCFCIYDMLLLNEEVLTNQLLKTRIEQLRDIVKEKQGVLKLSQHKEVKSQQEILDILNEYAENDQEGIVVKDPNSVYKYHDRKSGWYKLKIEYFDDAVTDLDVVLMGGCYKSLTNEINSYIVGVVEDNNVYSFGKVASGLNKEETKNINERLINKGYLTKDFSKFEPLYFGSELPDVWIEPWESVVFTIRATELIKLNNKDFMTTHTLRFPRIKLIREDKSFTECLSREELLEMCDQDKSVIKLNKKLVDLNDIHDVKRKKKETNVQVKTDLVPISSVLNGYRFYVQSDTKKFNKQDIHQTIIQLGGTYSFTADSGVQIILVGCFDPEINRLYRKKGFDIIKLEWLQRVKDSNTLVPYTPADIIYLNPSLDNILAKDVDLFGDSYLDCVTPDSLCSRLEEMSDTETLTNTYLKVMTPEIFQDDSDDLSG